MKPKQLILLAALFFAIQFNTFAQTNEPAAMEAQTNKGMLIGGNALMASNVITAVVGFHINKAIIPVSRTGSATKRQALVLQRAKDAPGDYDIEFIGDSITQFWETRGTNVWNQYYGKRKVINFGVSGDRTEHVLWRFEQGQLDGIKAKVAVLMIGTNNSGTNKDGTESYTTADILEGVTTIVQQVRARQPDTKILLLGIFPRGRTFCPQRGKILEVNQALARLDDGSHIFYLDFGAKFIGDDGSISKDIMPDALHPSEAGYKIWADAMEPKLEELLAAGR